MMGGTGGASRELTLGFCAAGAAAVACVVSSGLKDADPTEWLFGPPKKPAARGDGPWHKQLAAGKPSFGIFLNSAWYARSIAPHPPPPPPPPPPPLLPLPLPPLRLTQAAANARLPPR